MAHRDDWKPIERAGDPPRRKVQPPKKRGHSDLTRAEVRAQTLRALADGQFALLNGAGSNDFSVPTLSSHAGSAAAMKS